MLNAEEGEEYNLPEKVCPHYDGKWNDEKEIWKIENEEEKAAYETMYARSQKILIDIQKHVKYGYLKMK
jgi:hypothetical protein